MGTMSWTTLRMEILGLMCLTQHITHGHPSQILTSQCALKVTLLIQMKHAF
jgi:hypothetical protein